MKPKIVIIFFLFCTTHLFAQRIPLKEILKIPTTEITQYDIESLNKNQCLLQLGYGKYGIANPAVKKQFYGKQIERIELVYTKHNKGGNFNQQTLNLNRLKQLYAFAPELFAFAYTDWKIISQTTCDSDQSCLSFFHGFVITYKPAFTEEDRKKEITILNAMMNDLEKIEEKDKEKVSKKIMSNMKDKVVFDVFKRKKKEWKNVLVVVDATGSMSPYIQQMLLWLHLNHDNHNITFFNDGDSKDDYSKKIGHTGGIYSTQVNDFKNIQDKLSLCMRNGFGGDVPENDLEAILESTKTFDKYDEIVLVADNWANMRDYALRYKINKPIRIVLCGVSEANRWFNLQYLNLAYQTKGSIHTITEDIEHLYKMKAGDTITLNKEVFYLSKKEGFKSKYRVISPSVTVSKKFKLASEVNHVALKNTISYIETLIAYEKDLKHVKFNKRSITKEGILVFDYKGKHFEYDLKKLVKVTLIDNHNSAFDETYRIYTHDYSLELEFADSEHPKHIYRITFRSERKDAIVPIKRWSIAQYSRSPNNRFDSIKYIGALKINFQNLAKINRGGK